MKIMIVEDHSDIRRVLKKIVTLSFTEAVEFIECKNGEDAVAQYRRHHPDCVLMDVQLGKMSGMEATKQIIDMDGNAKIIIVTSYDTPFMRSKADELKVESFISKDHLLDIKPIIQSLNLK